MLFTPQETHHSNFVRYLIAYIMRTRGVWTGHPSWNWLTSPKLRVYKFWHFCPVCHDHSAKRPDYMGDFNIDLVKCESSNYSHNFLLSLQNCYLTPAIDKPTRVCSTSATLIDNIFINNPDKVVACGNLISDISDHFSQFCILKSMKDKIRVKKSKMRDFSRFSSDRLHADLSNVNWNALFSNESSDVKVFSSFYNKFNKLVNKHAPMKTIP